jgi:transposase-like protein
VLLCYVLWVSLNLRTLNAIAWHHDAPGSPLSPLPRHDYCPPRPDATGKQRYRCREHPCGGRTFLLDDSYAGQSPTVKEQMVDRAMNASGIRDPARVLHISTNSVRKELKKRRLRSPRCITGSCSSCVPSRSRGKSAAPRSWSGGVGSPQHATRCGHMARSNRNCVGCGTRLIITWGRAWRMCVDDGRTPKFIPIYSLRCLRGQEAPARAGGPCMGLQSCPPAFRALTRMTVDEVQHLGPRINGMDSPIFKEHAYKHRERWGINTR